MGFVMNDGSSFIISYNTECNMPQSSGKVWTNNQSSSTSCISGVFDYNSWRSPNKLGVDVINFNDSGGLGNKCAIETDSGCYSSAKAVLTPLTNTECNESKEELGLQYCATGDDYFAGAAKMCGGRDKIASARDLADIAQKLYGVSFGEQTSYKSGLTRNQVYNKQFGIPEHTWIYSSEERDESLCNYRRFSTNNSIYTVGYFNNYCYRDDNFVLVICKIEE